MWHRIGEQWALKPVLTIKHNPTSLQWTCLPALNHFCSSRSLRRNPLKHHQYQLTRSTIMASLAYAS
ncbi:hypothetical protein PISMIDRAFT_595876 [Pisolithus microcarpus 441]|uniref:Uncharacterized protein n=1 Tax=Pisolithus microcarpus 441 TaxID=765257 RepID=A0A0C9YU89_9AGAM|nr:hypothetical protein PISMIDRAFT_595876 [Pisolithus microcarpus 441]